MSRCCGRCDGVHDICVADQTCEAHKMLGCEICFGQRDPIELISRAFGREATCTQHRKDVFGKTDMKEVAKEIGDLHYEALTALMYELQAKILTDAAHDLIGKRFDLGHALLAVSDNISGAWVAMRKVWKLCKPKM